MEFSKKLLIFDYLLFIILCICAALIPMIDFATIIVTWVAQLGISSTAYYWKSKNENKIKVPMKVIETLPEEIRQEIDLTQIITTIIQSE